MSANVDSSQILRLQKKMASLELGRLVMLYEGLGDGSESGLRRDSILDFKVCSKVVLFARLFTFGKKGKVSFQEIHR